jgi:four helix bundle protein
MRRSALREKSFRLGKQVVDICRHLKYVNAEYTLYRQLLKSGTAIGTMVREAEYSQSNADFVNKLSIALKEANETEYWVDLLFVTSCCEESAIDPAKQTLTEIIKILVASINTSKSTMLKQVPPGS